MTIAELEFEFTRARLVVEGILTLPEALRPTHESMGEDEAGSIVEDTDKYLCRPDFIRRVSSVIFKGSRASYDLRKLRNGNLVCCVCFGGGALPSVDELKRFLSHMMKACPVFGFVCAEEEREQRNRVVIQQGVNFIESWVGRNTKRYIPGLYWTTLIADSLAERHQVSIRVIADAAREHVELGRGQHMFCFFERPEDWRSATAVIEKLYASLPGIFDVERVRSQLQGTKTFLEFNNMTNIWD